MQLLYALIAVVLLLPRQALAACVDGLSPCYEDATKNIFDTHEPICDPSTAVANGIVMCDGIEDGALVPDASNTPDAGSDYWSAASSGGSLGACNGCNDPLGRSFAECNTGTINTNQANFGAAGSACTATKGWRSSMETRHSLAIASSTPSDLKAVQNMYLRLYLKFAGTTSTRGDNSGFSLGGEANFKQVGFVCTDSSSLSCVNDTGGISYVNTGDPNGDGSLWYSAGDAGYCICGATCDNTGKTCADSNPAYCRPHSPYTAFDWDQHLDKWIFIEYHIAQSDTNDGSRFEMWVDDCGADGLGCTGTPTKRIDSGYTWDLNPDENACGGQGAGFFGVASAMYFDFGLGTGHAINGEIQYDQIVVKNGGTNGGANDFPIGFAAVSGGSTPSIKGSFNGKFSKTDEVNTWPSASR